MKELEERGTRGRAQWTALQDLRQHRNVIHYKLLNYFYGINKNRQVVLCIEEIPIETQPFMVRHK